MDTQTKQTLLEQFESVVSRISRYLAARAGGETGLSPSQRLVLRALGQGPLQVSEVAGHLGVTLSAATGLVDRMAKAHLVNRERDRADRRVVWVKLTEQGRRTLASAEGHRRQALVEMVEPLTGEEMEQLVRILDKLRVE